MLDDLDLDHLLIGAAESPPSTRIEFRDPIANHGTEAVRRVSPWLSEPGLAAFAVRVIRRAADFGARAEAIDVLNAALIGLQEPVLSDARSALRDLGVAERRHRPTGKRSLAADAPTSAEDLVAGRRYRRKELHDAGLGGNRQKGISYAAAGTDVLLFSDPSKGEEWGYRDSWQGPDAYRYYGEWSGTGDMTLSGGNREIVDRSPNLYLFTRLGDGFKFAGRFRCQGQSHVPASRDGKQWTAIVFDLVRG